MSLDVKRSHEQKHKSTRPGLTQKEVYGLHQTDLGTPPLNLKLLSFGICGKKILSAFAFPREVLTWGKVISACV